MARTVARKKPKLKLITDRDEIQANAPSEFAQSLVAKPDDGAPPALRDLRTGRAALHDIAKVADVKSAILGLIGDLDGLMLAPTKVLVAHYIAPERTAGGIIKPDTNKKEDVWQGAVVLILKKGALAFKDDGRNQFGGFDPRVGEWVTITPAEGKRRQINGVDCRTIDDALIDMVVPDPAMITHRT